MSQQFGTPKTGSSGSGTNGIDGLDGADGKSSYQIAVDNGFTGSEIEWLASLKGDKGDKGADGLAGQNIIDQRTQQPIKLWTGTQAQYDATSPKLTDMLYLVKL